MATFHTLKLRESSVKQEKNLLSRVQTKEKKKTFLKELLTQNFIKRYTQKMQPGSVTAQINLLIQSIVIQEIEFFMQSQQLSQKNLKTIEKQIEKILEQDPRIAPLILGGQSSSYGFNDNMRRNSSTGGEAPNKNAASQSNFVLPKINQSVTPTRDQVTKSSAFQKNRFTQIIRDQSTIAYNKTNVSPYGLDDRVNPNQKSMKTLANPLSQSQYNNIITSKGMISQRTDIHNHSVILNNNNSKANLISHKQSNSFIPTSRKNDVSKSYADLRLKLGEKRKKSDIEDGESQPSDLSNDEWVEIVNYQQERFEEDKKKEKEEFEVRKRNLKEVLDKQLREAQQKKEREKQDKYSYDIELLKNIKQKEEIEVNKQTQMKSKVYEQKAMRDWQLQEAKKKKQIDYQQQREQEIEFVSKLRQEIDQEKEQKLKKKMDEREQAWKVINENQVYKQQQVVEKEKEKERDNKVVEDYNKMLDLIEQKRLQEWQQREEKISHFMNQMADTVKKSNDAEKQLEKRVVQYQLSKEERDQKEETRKKEEMKRKHEEIRSKLDLQIQQKKMQKQYENFVNDDYMKKWIQLREDDEARRKAIEDQKQKQKYEVKDYLKMQMGEVAHNESGAVSTVTMHKKKKDSLGIMTTEELRLNKQLLKEISKRKKEKLGQSDASIVSHDLYGNN